MISGMKSSSITIAAILAASMMAPSSVQAQPSCVGECGNPFPTGLPCACDDFCTFFGDCCPDFESVCTGVGAPFAPPQFNDPLSCEGDCGEFFGLTVCNCDPTCIFYNDCCDDFFDVCFNNLPPFAPFPLAPIPFAPPGGQSCEGECGEFLGFFTCNCDDLCTFYLDCCPDFDALCIVPPPPSVVLSDPHLLGLKGQSFDFTGEPGRIYALISDKNLELNALFSTAFTSGVFLDSERMVADSFKSSGTWISAIGLQVNSDKLQMSVEDSDDAICGGSDIPGRLDGCLIGGSVTLNDVPLLKVGPYESDSLSLNLKNSKSFARVEVQSETISITLDYVPPAQEWGISEADKSIYSHINIKVVRLALTDVAHGVLGSTKSIRYDENNQPIMSSSGKNGEGILDGAPEDYVVSDIFASDFKFAPQK